MTYEEAKAHVLEFLNNKDRDYQVMVYEPAKEVEYGWIFGYDHEDRFRPERLAVEQKFTQLHASGGDMQVAYDQLSPAEKEAYDSAIGLAGNHPVFIDQETGEIQHCNELFLDVFLQKIKERKTGRQYEWKLYLLAELKGNAAKIKELRQALDLSMGETKNLLKNTPPFLHSQNFEQVSFWKKSLEDLGYPYRVEEVERRLS